MRISKADIARVKREVDLMSLVGVELKKIANTSGGEYVSSCLFCGGEDRFHVQPHHKSGGRWFCRQCTGDPESAGWRDVFDFVMQRDGIGFADAYELLADLPPTPRAPAKPCQSKADWQSLRWQDRAWTDIKQAIWTLNHANAGETSRTYLTDRRIEPAVWQAWQLGHAKVWNPMLCQRMSAIVLPWHDDQTVNAVQYRFTQTDLPKKARFGQKPGGNRMLFGLHLLQGQQQLVLIEGELNAVSIWQVSDNLDVLSWGPQGNIVRPEVAKMAAEVGSRYHQLLLWADTFQAALNAVVALQESGLNTNKVTLVESPNNLDANDLLTIGDLPQYLSTIV